MSVDLRGRTTAGAVGCKPFTAEGSVLPQVRVRFVVDRVVLGQVSIQSTLVFPCSCHYTSIKYSSSPTCCSYQKNKRVKPGKIPENSSTLSRSWEH